MGGQPLLLGPGHHLAQRAAGAAGHPGGVVVFDLDPPGADLDPHGQPVDLDRRRSARACGQRSRRWPRTPSEPVSAVSTAGHLAGQRGIGQGADRVGRPALLHDDGGDPGVVGAGLEQRADGVGQRLAGGVVDVDLEQHDGLAGRSARPDRRRRSPPGSGWGARRDRPEPAPKPVRSMVMAGIGPHWVTRAASRAAPVGVVSSSGHVELVGGRAAQQLDHRRGRDRAAVRGRRAPCRCRWPRRWRRPRRCRAPRARRRCRPRR